VTVYHPPLPPKHPAHGRFRGDACHQKAAHWRYRGEAGPQKAAGDSKSIQFCAGPRGCQEAPSLPPGTVALREIRKLQRSTDLLIRKLPLVDWCAKLHRITLLDPEKCYAVNLNRSSISAARGSRGISCEVDGEQQSMCNTWQARHYHAEGCTINA
jgi:hypothetical protein